MRIFTVLIALILGAALTFAQKDIDSRTAASTATIDFTGSAVTRTIKSGTSLPAACTAGKDLYFKTDATAGSNLYACTSTNTWTVQAGGGADGVGYDEIEDEGSGLTKRAKINFVGSNISCADSGGKTVCTVTGASAPSGYPLVKCSDFVGESGSGPANNAEVTYDGITGFYTGATGEYKAETGAEGVLVLVTGTSSGNSAAVGIGAQSPRAWTNLNTYSAGKWWEWVLEVTSTTSIRQGGGLAADSGPTNDGVHFNMDTDNTETTWRFFSRNAATDTSRIDTGVTVTADNWYRARMTKISSPANGMQFQVSAGQSTEEAAKVAALGTAYTICPNAGCTVNATVDNDAVMMYFGNTTRTASAARMSVGAACWTPSGWQ